jgi:peptidoglycan/LPS O-acetylase OafA/YrhL
MGKEINSRYFYFLDVLRFIAIFISFLHHSDIIFFLHGHTFFFVLSGFVLTYQAHIEYERTNQFSWYNFTMRRVLRIFPLYFLIIFGSYFIIPQFTKLGITLAPIQYYLTFTSNYYSISHVFILMILWSVAVQEQFYLFISFCYRFFFKYLSYISVFMIIISIFYKIYAEYHNYNIYANTLTHFSSFGIGILVARYFLGGKVIDSKSKFNRIVLLACFIFLVSTSFYSGFYWSIVNNTIVSLILGYIILFLSTVVINQNNQIFKVFEQLGKFSYGLYCFQGVVITFGNIILSKYLGSNQVYWIVVINFILLIFISFLSYRFFEVKILDLKKYFR